MSIILNLADARKRNLIELLKKRCDDLAWSVRTANCLQNAGIDFIWQLVTQTEAMLVKSKHFGRKSIKEIKDVLNDLDLGLSLDMRLTNGVKHAIGVTPDPDDPVDDHEVVVVEIPLDSAWRVSDQELGPIRRILAEELTRLRARSTVLQMCGEVLEDKSAAEVSASADPMVVRAILIGKTLMNR